MSKSRRSYPPEFRRQMVELVRAGRTPEELAVLTSQPVQLFALRAGQIAVAAARVTLRLHRPVADRLRRRLELSRQFLRRAAGSYQFHHLTAELRRIGSSALRHRGLLEHKWSAVHETGATSVHQFASRVYGDGRQPSIDICASG